MLNLHIDCPLGVEHFNVTRYCYIIALVGLCKIKHQLLSEFSSVI